jgi:hypothetical protein
MPVHDWTRVPAGIFHHFHHGWIEDIGRALNRGILPHPYYALVEQIHEGLGLDVRSLEGPSLARKEDYSPPGKAVVIRHVRNHQVIALIEVVSPGNKNSRHGLLTFVAKAEELLQSGFHLLIVDLFPPGPRDPQGIHRAIWGEFSEDDDFVFSADRPFTLAAYSAGPCPEAFVEPTAVGASLSEMPLFLTPDYYVPVPLEKTYQTAWEAVPLYWREVLTAGGGP